MTELDLIAAQSETATDAMNTAKNSAVNDLAAEPFTTLEIPAKMSLEEEIIARASGNHEPLPMLDVIFGRLVTALCPMLKSQNGLLSEVVDKRLDYLGWGKAIEALDVNGAAAVATSSWGGPIIMAIDAAFLHVAVESMLGGTPRLGKVPNRMPTQLEKAFAERLVRQSLQELANHFSRITEVSFTLDNVESPQQISSLLASAALSAVGEIDISFGAAQGRMSVILPMETLEPARAQLGKMFLGEKLGADSSWRDHFTNNITGASMQIAAQMHRMEVPLADVLGWRPGTTLDLGVTLEHEATVICSGHAILHGATGRKRNGKLALRVTREAGEEKGGADNDLITD